MKYLEVVRETVEHVFWTLVLAGFFFLVLAVLIVLYPSILIGLVAATFIIFGVCLISMAIRIKQLWNKVPGFLK